GGVLGALQGLFYRTLHLLENGIKPVFVFDGKPPDLKQAVVRKGDGRSFAGGGQCLPCLIVGWCLKFTKTASKIVFHHLPCRLPLLAGLQAPAEAEATCAALVKSGHAWCTATEDLDALPFGSLRLLRHLNTKSGDLEEIALPEVLQKLRLTQEQFVDLCILLGCDYCGKIHGVGPKKALKLMQQHGSIERILQLTSRQAYPLPDRWALQETRQLFLQPEVADPGQVELRWPEPDEEGLVRFLSHEKCMKRPVRGPAGSGRHPWPRGPCQKEGRWKRGEEGGRRQSHWWGAGQRRRESLAGAQNGRSKFLLLCYHCSLLLSWCTRMGTLEGWAERSWGDWDPGPRTGWGGSAGRTGLPAPRLPASAAGAGWRLERAARPSSALWAPPSSPASPEKSVP
uniref:XPG-I domain-containing protein n=1 Tax=Varanus komodoensis TaxID=61221 RepID=A0A8D2IRJ2_VARKO